MAIVIKQPGPSSTLDLLNVLGAGAAGVAQGLGRRRLREQQQREVLAREQRREARDVRAGARGQARQIRREQRVEEARRVEDFSEQARRGLADADAASGALQKHQAIQSQEAEANLAFSRGDITGQQLQGILQNLDKEKIALGAVFKRKRSPWPDKQGPGQVWLERGVGRVTRNANGDVKLLDKSITLGEYSRVRQMAIDSLLLEGVEVENNPDAVGKRVMTILNGYQDLIGAEGKFGGRQQMDPAGLEATRGGPTISGAQPPPGAQRRVAPPPAPATPTGVPDEDQGILLLAKEMRDIQESAISPAGLIEAKKRRISLKRLEELSFGSQKAAGFVNQAEALAHAMRKKIEKLANDPDLDKKIRETEFAQRLRTPEEIVQERTQLIQQSRRASPQDRVVIQRRLEELKKELRALLKKSRR